MLTGEVGRRLPHPLHVGAIVQKRHVFPVEHRLHRPIEADVAVRLAQRVVAGVEPRRRLLYLPHGDGVRQIAVQVVADGFRRLLHVQHHVGRHGPGVDARIGAARAGDVHRMALQAGKHALQLALYRILPRLALPAEKAGAVVGDGQLIVLFHKKSRPFRLIVAERT